MAAALIVVAVISIAPMSMYESDATDASNDDFVTKVTSATAGDTIKLTGNVDLTGTGGSYFVTVDEKLTIDLNGYSIKPADNSGMTSYPYAIKVDNGGDLTITDTSTDKNGSIESRGIHVVAQGKLTLENGTVKALDVAGAAVFCRGTFVMNGGTLESAGGYDSQNNASARALVVMVDASGSTSANATINSGTVKANYTAITNMGELEIVNCTVNAQTAIDNDQGATATIKGGKFSALSAYPLIRNDGTINISGGTFSNDNYVALWNESNATISGGTFESKSRAGQTTFGYAITSAKGQLTINETDGEVSVSGGFGAVSVTGGTANISAGTFSVIQDTSGDGGYYALYVADEAENGSPDVTVSGGDFISYKNSTVCVETYSNSTNQFLKISGGDFSIADNSGNNSSIIIRYAPNPYGGFPSASVSGGTFSSSLGDADVASNCSVGTDAEGNTIVGTPITVIVSVNGTPQIYQIPAGACLPETAVPAETAGYTYGYGYDIDRDTLLKYEFTTPTNVTISKALDPPIVVVTGGGSVAYGEKAKLNSTVTHDISGLTYTYQWYKDDAPITDATKSEYEAAATGTYYLVVTASDGTLESTGTSASVQVTIGDAPTHMITFIANGETVKTLSVTEGDYISESDFPTAPAKTGYTFVKWTNETGTDPVLGPVTSSFSIIASYRLNAPSKVTVELSGPLYEGGSITATVTAEHELEGVTFQYAMAEIGVSISNFGESPTFTIDHAGEYAFAVGAIYNGDYSEGIATSGTIEVTYSAQPSPGYDDDEDLPPFVPGQTQGSDDGSVTIGSSWEDHGQGADSGAQCTAHEALRPLGIPVEKIHLVMNDTSKTPNSGPAGGSRSQVMTGNAIRVSCEMLIEAMRKPEGGFYTYDEMKAEGRDVRQNGKWTAPARDCGKNCQGEPFCCYMYGLFMAEVAVEVATGKTTVEKMTMVADIGKVVNRLLTDGQLYGGIAQGVGLALSEDYEDIKKHSTMAGAGIPYIKDIPDNIELIYVETPRPDGPFGASGTGEIPLCGPHPAIINAIYNACGARVTHLPAYPEKVLAAMKK